MFSDSRLSWATARSSAWAGALTKIVTGFDLIGLFTGSEGMLGLVTEATMRLIPLPPTRSCLRAEFISVAKAAAGVQKILGSGLLPCALEIADPFTLAAAEKRFPTHPTAIRCLSSNLTDNPPLSKASLPLRQRFCVPPRPRLSRLTATPLVKRSGRFAEALATP